MMPQIPAAHDWHKADVKAALEKAGFSLSRLSRESGLQAGTLRKVFVMPYPKAQRIIARAIGVDPRDIWPSRYPKPMRAPALSAPRQTSRGTGPVKRAA